MPTLTSEEFYCVRCGTNVKITKAMQVSLTHLFQCGKKDDLHPLMSLQSP